MILIGRERDWSRRGALSNTSNRREKRGDTSEEKTRSFRNERIVLRPDNAELSLEANSIARS
jgi:hypothetical protein